MDYDSSQTSNGNTNLLFLLLLIIYLSFCFCCRLIYALHVFLWSSLLLTAALLFLISSSIRSHFSLWLVSLTPLSFRLSLSCARSLPSYPFFYPPSIVILMLSSSLHSICISLQCGQHFLFCRNFNSHCPVSFFSPFLLIIISQRRSSTILCIFEKIKLGAKKSSGKVVPINMTLCWHYTVHYHFYSSGFVFFSHFHK